MEKLCSLQGQQPQISSSPSADPFYLCYSVSTEPFQKQYKESLCVRLKVCVCVLLKVKVFCTASGGFLNSKTGLVQLNVCNIATQTVLAVSLRFICVFLLLWFLLYYNLSENVLSISRNDTQRTLKNTFKLTIF